MPGTSSNSARVAWLCAGVLAVFVIWLAAPSSANIGIGFFYSIPIGLATWWFGLRAGAITLLACSVLYCIGVLIDPIDHFGIALALRMLAFAGVVTIVSLLRERQLTLERSAEELEAIRAALTPTALPRLPGVDAAAAAFVSSEHGVSGDFYLLTNGPDNSAVAIVGDVVGHGPAAAQLATFVRTRFAALAAGTSDPAELLTLVNDALVDRAGHERELVSAVCLRLLGEELRWAIAGHPPPLLLPGLEELTVHSTYLLGADAGLELANREATLRRGEGVVVYTDGVTDVRRDDAMLGLEGLRRVLAPLAGEPAPSIVSRTEQAILEWAEKPIRDDLCLLALKPR